MIIIVISGAAVLIYSIIEAHNSSKLNDYKISFVALVHPDVKQSVPYLSKLGYHVIQVPVPVNVTAIKHKYLREKIDSTEFGCCGAAELIKLAIYRYN